MHNPFKNKRHEAKEKQNPQKYIKDNFIFLFKLDKISD
jgi:hypothetical protein